MLKTRLSNRMTSVSDAMFKEVNAAAVEAVAAEAVPVPPTTNWRLIIGLGVGIVLLSILLVGIYQYFKLSSSPWWSERAKASQSVFSLLDKATESTPEGAIKSKTITLPPSEDSNSARERVIERSATPIKVSETWCFVGEDLAGRYCVKVPNEDACTKERSYASRSDCELTPANAMPSGNLKDGNTGIDYLYKKSSIPVELDAVLPQN